MMLHQEKATAVIAAISSKFGLIHYDEKESSFDSVNFKEFLQYLRGQIQENSFAIVLENCSIHRTKEVRDFCSLKNIKLLFQVPYH